MSHDKTGGRAFPSHKAGRSDPRNRISGGGMSLRDYFAAKAMQAVAANPNGLEVPKNIAIYAYQVADAMLAERAK